MKKQFLVIGAGRFGKGVIKELAKQNNVVISVCDESEENLREIEDIVEVCVVGNCIDEEVLEELNVEEYDVVIVAIGSNSYSAIIITKKLKDKKVKRIITKALSKEVGEILTILGADRVVYPEEETGKRIARQEVFEGVVEYFQLTDEISAIEMKVPEVFIGKSLIEIEFSKKTNLTVSLVLRDGKPLSNRFADVKLQKNDVLVIVGEIGKIEKLKKKFV